LLSNLVLLTVLSTLVLSNLAATLFLTGVVWFLQVVQFPLLLRAGGSNFVAYVKAQRKRNSLLMALPMLVELITGVWLLVTPLPHRDVFHGVVLLGFIWLVTLGSIVPLNSRLTRGYDESTIRVLIRDNWIRTICWTGRSGLMIWITAGWVKAG
jgi:hypothetical protein